METARETGSHAFGATWDSAKAVPAFWGPVDTYAKYEESGGTVTTGVVEFGTAQSVPIIYDFAQTIAALGVSEVESIVGYKGEGQLTLWVVVDDADRATRKRIHQAEWTVMLRYPDDDLLFELIRRGHRPLKSLFTFPSKAIALDMRGLRAYSARAWTTG